jgi:membrane peptidoglycan carboxypeptidase
MAALASMGLFCLFLVAVKDLPRVPEPIGRINDTPATEIFSADGQRILTIGGRETVALDDVSYAFIQAILATEDHRFWEHRGINKLRTLKALWVTLFEPGKVQGASTITQQLAKNLFFSFERTYVRKFRELLVALQIEAQFSKQEILEAYINQIPFGVGAYGIGEAARTFFGKTAGELTLAEASLLAGLPKSPTRYNPFRYPDRARAAASGAGRMVTTGMISRQEADEARPRRLTCKIGPFAAGGQLFSGRGDEIAWKRPTAPRWFTTAVLRVYTTLDVRHAAAGRNRPAGGDCRAGSPDGWPTGPPTASVEDKRASGGAGQPRCQYRCGQGAGRRRDFFQTPYNRALQNNRQPGSGFKPFLYYVSWETVGKPRPM